MKILFVTATYKPSTNGVSIAIDITVNKLRQLGQDVYVLAPEHKNLEENDPFVIRYPSLVNQKNLDYPIPLFPMRVNELISLWNTSFDLIHVHHPFYIFTMGDIIANIHKCPIVFTFHTNYETYSKLYFKSIPKKLNKLWIENTIEKIGKKANLIISPSQEKKNEILELSPQANVSVLTTGVDTTNKVLDKQKAKKLLGWPSDKKVLLSLSRLAKEKNIETAVKALKYLDDSFVLYIVGTGPSEQDLKDLVIKNKLESQVFFTGGVDHDDTHKYYNAADIFLFPSITETQGLTAFESAAMETPIIAVDSEVAREFLRTAGAAISKNNPSLFALEIKKMSESDPNVIGSQLREWVSEYSIDNYIKKLMSLYGSIL